MPLLEGLDGVEKMSKSKKNYIGIDEIPQEMYGKAMAISDKLMPKYFELVTDFTSEQIHTTQKQLETGELHPRDAKMLLGKTIVRMYHGIDAAEQAEQNFISVFQKGSMPDDIPVRKWKGNKETSIVELLVGLEMLSSKSEARRMIDNRGVKVNGKQVDNPKLPLIVTDGLIVQVGKRKFVKVKI